MHKLKKIAQTTKAMLPNHFRTLLGERSGGSKWGRRFLVRDWDLPWVDATDDLPEHVRRPRCRYYRLRNAFEWFPDMEVRAVALGDIIDKQRPDDAVSMQDGDHGPELVIDGRSEFFEKIWMQQVLSCDAWAIVGQHEGFEVIFTAHPGEPLLPLIAGEPLNAWTAVKVGRVGE